MKRLKATIWLFLFSAGLVPALAAAQGIIIDGTMNPRGGDQPTIVHSSYDYSPSSMRDTSGSYRLWWCSTNTTNPGNFKDRVYHSTSSALGSGWSAPAIVFAPSTTSGKFDTAHVCDPSVVKANGVYYLYYTGTNDPNGTNNRVGVAQSSDGITWTRLNSGNPIVTPYQGGTPYGAGQPSVAYLDEWFYMLYHDDSGQTGNPAAGYVLRSRSPLFPFDPNQTQELSNNGGVIGFWPIDSSRRTNHMLRALINADLTFNKSLNMFTVSVDGNTGLLSEVFFTRDLLTELGIGEWAGSWREGPGNVRSPDGKSLLNPSSNMFQAQGQCVLPFDRFRAVGTADVLTWDLAWSGIDFVIRQRCARGRIPYDYDRDGTGDPVVFRPSSATFFVRKSNSPTQQLALGASTSTPVKGDFDGDGVADLAVVTPNNGFLDWTISKSTGGTRFQPTWGLTTDKIGVGDFNGDKKDDITVFRDGNWYITYDNGTVETWGWGLVGDVPVPGDYDGDNIDDFAIYRPNNGTWYFNYRAGGVGQYSWGAPTDIPVPADWFSEGRSAIGVWRPSDGTWYLVSPLSGQIERTQWGLSDDVPVVGDFEGDGKVDLTVWRPSEGNWYQNRRTGTTVVTQWGLPGDLLPVNRCLGVNRCP